MHGAHGSLQVILNAIKIGFRGIFLLPYLSVISCPLDNTAHFPSGASAICYDVAWCGPERC